VLTRPVSASLEWNGSHILVPSLFQEDPVMAHPSRCPFCRQLPSVGKHTPVKPGKCPLCKSGLLTDPRTGASYLPAGEVPEEGGRPRGHTYRKAAAVLA